ncbi:MAG: MATE family efflux transporter [Pseudomonadota bacterium]
MPTSTLTPASPLPAASAGVLLRQIGALAAPTTALSLLQVGAQLAETVLAARQGTAALAGWAVLLPFALLLAQMSTGAMGGGVVAAVARALGGQRREEASALVLHAMLIATAGGLLFAVGVSLLAGPLVHAVAGAEAAAHAGPYAWWLFGAGAVPAWWTNTLASVLRGGGQHALAARILALQWLAYPVLAWALAEPLGGGLAGVGAAYAITNALAAVVMLRLVQRGGAGFQPGWRATPQWPMFRNILQVGAVASGLALLANLTTIIVTSQLRHLGPATVAAYGIAARLEFLVIPLAWGVGSALTALVGRAVGGGDWPRARRTAWLGGAMALACTALIGLLVALLPLQFAQLFSADAEVVAMAARALRYTGLSFGAFGLGMAMYFAAMGAQRMGAAVLAGFARLGTATGLGWCLAHGFWGLGGWQGMGPDGHFLGVALGLLAYGLISAGGVRASVWRAR